MNIYSTGWAKQCEIQTVFILSDIHAIMFIDKIQMKERKFKDNQTQIDSSARFQKNWWRNQLHRITQQILMGYALCDSELGLRTIQQNPSTTNLVSHLHSFQGIPRKFWLKVQIQILPSLFNSLCHLFLLKLPHLIPIPSGINPYFMTIVIFCLTYHIILRLHMVEFSRI